MIPKSYPEQHGTLDSLLRSLSEALQREVYECLASVGFPEVRPAHSAVFRHLSVDGARVAELAAWAGMKKQSMSYLVEDLQSLGFLIDEPDPEDGRARLIRLTERGKAAQEALVRLSAQTEASWSAQVGRKEWADTRATLERLAKLLSP